MKTKLIRRGLVIIIVGIVVIFLPIIPAFYINISENPDTFILLYHISNITFVIGFFMIIIGIITIVLGYIKKSNALSRRNCPKCGRKIQFDARVCPYCKKDFEED